jgi:hypothetical protein
LAPPHNQSSFLSAAPLGPVWVIVNRLRECRVSGVF